MQADHNSLERLLGECELNYQRLQELVPALRARQGAANACVADAPPLRLEVLDHGPYTTTLELHQPHQNGSPWLSLPRMRIRAYHDARLAEVVCYQGEGRFNPRYPHPYPNRGMIRRDEKQQVNFLLGEWLKLCLVRGYRFEAEEAVAD